MPTPSLAALVVHEFKMRSDTLVYNLGGQGCSAGLLAVGLAEELLQARSACCCCCCCCAAHTHTYTRTRILAHAHAHAHAHVCLALEGVTLLCVQVYPNINVLVVTHENITAK